MKNIFLTGFILLLLAHQARADHYGLTPENPESIKALVQAYLDGDEKTFEPADRKGPSNLIISLRTYLSHTRDAEFKNSVESYRTAIWALQTLGSTYLLKSARRNLETRETVERKDLSAFDYDLSTLVEEGSTQQSALVQILLSEAKSKNAEVAGEASQAIQRLCDTLTLIALEQGELSTIPDLAQTSIYFSATLRTEHIRDAVDLLYQLGERPEAVQALAKLIQGQPGRTDPKSPHSSLQLGYPREKLASVYATDALGTLAREKYPELYAKSCAALLGA